MSHELKTIRETAKQFAKEHLSECAAELLVWHSTSLLKDGRVRELARMLRPIHSSDALQGAELYINRAALNAAATLTTSEGWLIDGSLVYKLDPTGSMNVCEINVTQADGTRRKDGPRVQLAHKIRDLLSSSDPQ